MTNRVRFLTTKLDPYLVLGFCVGLAALSFFVPRFLASEPSWVKDFENLGMVDRYGDQKARNTILLVTSLDCAVCRETFKNLVPIFENELENGQVRFTIVNIVADEKLSHMILDAKDAVKLVDPQLGLALYHALVENYDQLNSEMKPQDIVNTAGLGLEIPALDREWSPNIQESLLVMRKARINTVPGWFLNNKQIGGDLYNMSELLRNTIVGNSPAP